ncbi:MAG: helix-turn-helix domain-containing protein [Nitratireductor sp.]
MKDLIREAVDVIEKLCIEAALRQTENNRASAADLLGVSRQSLYMKLRRHDLEDFTGEE